MDAVGKRRRTNRRSRVETEPDTGLEVAAQWAKEDDKYRTLLHIAKAVDEARRAIDVQTLQHLIDPEHRTDVGDWGQILGRSGLQRRSRTERYERQGLRRCCSQALPESQNPTVIANRFRGTKPVSASGTEKCVSGPVGGRDGSNRDIALA